MKDIARAGTQTHSDTAGQSAGPNDAARLRWLPVPAIVGGCVGSALLLAKLALGARWTTMFGRLAFNTQRATATPSTS